MATFSFEPRLPLGSLILVTGVNGLVASHVANLALASGFRVRGTVRDVAKASWMTEKFDKEYGAGKFELVEVKDLSVDGAFDEAVKGCAGIAHIASIVGSPDPHVMIPGVINGAISILKSAQATPSVKAVVYTSSSWSASYPLPNKVYTIDTTSWNEDAISHAWDPPPYDTARIMPVYAASKAMAEKKCWEWVGENKPGFAFSTVLPAANFGKIVSTRNQGWPSTTAWVKDLFQGVVNVQPFIPPQRFADTVDVARLHLAALIDPQVNGERVLAFAEAYDWNQVLRVFRKVWPERKFVDDLEYQGEDKSVVDTKKSMEMLKRMGVDGYTGLEQSLRWNVEDLV